MRLIKCTLFLQLAVLMHNCCLAASATTLPISFNNGTLVDHVKWLDTSNNLINAHDGGIIYANGKYHWYGMALRPTAVSAGENGGQKTTTGVIMYCSTDLYNWSYGGVILGCATNADSPLLGPMRFERPKIIYDDFTKEFVMWFHYVGHPGDHGNAVGFGDAGVASCKTVNGKYIFHGYARPLDSNGIVRDSTLYKDDDGKAYFIYDRDVRIPGPEYGRFLTIVELSRDYLSWTTNFFKITNAPYREAPVMLKHDHFYYLITSAETGWRFNRANYYRSSNIFGPYASFGDPCIGSNNAETFNSQGTFAFSVTGNPDEFVFMSERHDTNCMTDSSFIFLPVNFTPNAELQLKYVPIWNSDYWSNLSSANPSKN